MALKTNTFVQVLTTRQIDCQLLTTQSTPQRVYKELYYNALSILLLNGTIIAISKL